MRRALKQMLCACLVPAVAAGAQGTVRGVLFDSLRSHAPVARAEVVLFGTSRRDEDLTRVPIITGSVLGGKVPRSRSRGDLLQLERNGGWCTPRLFVDGADYGNKTMGEWKEFLPRAKHVEVYRAAFAPAKYTDLDGCGMVVISTK